MDSALGHVNLAPVHELDEEEGVLERSVLEADDELATVADSGRVVEVGAAATGAVKGEKEILKVGRAGGEHHL